MDPRKICMFVFCQFACYIDELVFMEHAKRKRVSAVWNISPNKPLRYNNNTSSVLLYLTCIMRGIELDPAKTTKAVVEPQHQQEKEKTKAEVQKVPAVSVTADKLLGCDLPFYR